MKDPDRNGDAKVFCVWREHYAFLHYAHRIKNQYTEPAFDHHQGFFFVRIKMAMRRNISARFQGIEQAMTTRLVVGMAIEIFAQAGTGGGFAG